MHKLFALFLLLLIGWAKGTNYELLSSNIKSYNKTIVASGNVILISDDEYITASKAKYSDKQRVIELFGDIHIFSKERLLLKTEYLKIHLDEDMLFTSETLLIDKKSAQWFNTKEIKKVKHRYYFKNSTLSSCNVDNPDWKIEFSSGAYNSELEWAHLFNSIVYIHNIPIFYLPYIAYPTDNERQSGLLPPEFSLLEDDGFSIIQPLYIAPYKSWDLELKPQYRTLRGSGIYSTLRVKDSPNSYLQIDSGYMNDNYQYTIDNELANSEHYGFNVKYNRDNIFSSKDKLLIDYRFLNDTDYYNLRSLNTESVEYDEIITSTLNYIYNGDTFYYGIYPRYFINIASEDNSKTLQLLPHQQLHKYSKPLLIDNILYSFDIRSKNYVRNKGLNATLNELLVPISFNLSLFDYAQFNISENIYIAKISTTKNTQPITQGSLIRFFTKASLDFDLVKEYDSFFHILSFGSYMVEPLEQRVKGEVPNISINEEIEDIDIDEVNDDDTSFITYLNESKSINSYLYNYIYPNNYIKKITQRTLQPFIYNDLTKNYELGSLYNDISIAFNFNISVSNSIKYSQELDKILTSSSSFAYSNSRSKFNFHFSTSNTDSYNEFIKSNFEQKLGYNYRIKAQVSYDNIEKYVSTYLIGLSMNKRCWNYALSFKQSLTPVLSNDGIVKNINQIIYFSISLIPLGTFNYSKINNIKG